MEMSMKRARTWIQILMKRIYGPVQSAALKIIQCHVSVHAAGLKGMNGFLI